MRVVKDLGQAIGQVFGQIAEAQRNDLAVVDSLHGRRLGEVVRLAHAYFDSSWVISILGLSLQPELVRPLHPVIKVD